MDSHRRRRCSAETECRRRHASTTNSFPPALPRSECGRIEQDNASLTSQIDGQRTAQAEVYFYLQKKLEDNYENIATLEARVSQDREMRARK